MCSDNQVQRMDEALELAISTILSDRKVESRLYNIIPKPKYPPKNRPVIYLVKNLYFYRNFKTEK